MAQQKKQSDFKEVLRLVGQLSAEELLELRRQLDSKSITWSNVDLRNTYEREALFAQEETKAKMRISQAFKKLQDQGILDANGYLIDSRLPSDMEPASECDVGG